MTDKKPGSTEATVMGLPEVRQDATQVIDSPIQSQPALDPANTVPGLDPISTAPSLAPVVTPPPPPPRSKTGSAIPRTKTAGAVPRAEAPRRHSRIAHATPQDSVPTTDPLPAVTRDPFEWTMPRVAGLAGAVGLAFILLWVFWPSKKPAQPLAQDPEPLALEAPVVAPRPQPIAPVAAPLAVAPEKPTLKLDAKKHVIDPFGAHLPDLELDPAHKYRLRIERDDGHLGTALARLDEKNGWGVMRKMASHAVLQFGGAKALRVHCQPGTHFHDGQTLPLELHDLATKKKIAVSVNPALHCWDFEVTRMMELGEGVKQRVRVPTDATVTLGGKVPLRVAYVLESLGEKKQWRTGVLSPGESVLAEGRIARFAILDSYAGDNEGTLALEILSGDTENSGLVTPSASGAQFVPAPK